VEDLDFTFFLCHEALVADVGEEESFGDGDVGGVLVGGALVEVPLTAHMGITASFLSSCPSCRYPCHFHLIKDILQ
jgi:hypothetical protein